jgi:hypothetical protein
MHFTVHRVQSITQQLEEIRSLLQSKSEKKDKSHSKRSEDELDEDGNSYQIEFQSPTWLQFSASMLTWCEEILCRLYMTQRDSLLAETVRDHAMDVSQLRTRKKR